MEYLQRVERNGIFIIIQGGSEEELLDLRVLIDTRVYTHVQMAFICQQIVKKMFEKCFA
jgi:hypothetical protein